MSAAELMADDGGDELASVAQTAKRSAFWHGVLEGFGGPSLMGLNSEDTHRHPRIAAAYREIFKSAFSRANSASPAQTIDQQVAESFYKSLKELVEKHQLDLRQTLSITSDESMKSNDVILKEIEAILSDRHGKR